MGSLSSGIMCAGGVSCHTFVQHCDSDDALICMGKMNIGLPVSKENQLQYICLFKSYYASLYHTVNVNIPIQTRMEKSLKNCETFDFIIIS